MACLSLDLARLCIAAAVTVLASSSAPSPPLHPSSPSPKPYLPHHLACRRRHRTHSDIIIVLGQSIAKQPSCSCCLLMVVMAPGSRALMT